MTLSIAISLAVMLVGLALYLMSAKPKPQELGRLMFFAGLLISLLRFAGQAALHVG